MTTATAYSHREEMAALRAEGKSYADIGAQYGYSHEHVRNVLGDTKETPWSEQRAEARATRLAEIQDWLNANGPVLRTDLMQQFGLSDSQLVHMIGQGLESHLILTPPREHDVDFTIERVHQALRWAWSEVQRLDPTATGLSHARYDEVRRADEPSGPLIVSRYGWASICEQAGVPSGQYRRPPGSYTSAWTDAEILGAIREYTDWARVQKKRPSYTGYDRWQRDLPDAPSGSTVRNRMRQVGYRTWPEIVQAALS